MKEYQDYLDRKRFVPKKRIPTYVAWVTQLYGFYDKKPTDDMTSEEIDQFLKHLTRSKEEWQVDQASDAIRIYQFYKFQSDKPLGKRNNSAKDQWKFVADEMINMLRLLGHSSLKTTMIYTHVAAKNRFGVKSPMDSLKK